MVLTNKFDKTAPLKPWRNIKEKRPERDSLVFVYGPECGIVPARFSGKFFFSLHEEDPMALHITHWKYIDYPDPPEDPKFLV